MEDLKKYWWIALVLGAIMFFTVGKKHKRSGKRMTAYRKSRMALSNFRTGWKARTGTRGFRNRLRHIRSGQFEKKKFR